VERGKGNELTSADERRRSGGTWLQQRFGEVGGQDRGEKVGDERKKLRVGRLFFSEKSHGRFVLEEAQCFLRVGPARQRRQALQDAACAQRTPAGPRALVGRTGAEPGPSGASARSLGRGRARSRGGVLARRWAATLGAGVGRTGGKERGEGATGPAEMGQGRGVGPLSLSFYSRNCFFLFIYST
jgi:hypothetical protein